MKDSGAQKASDPVEGATRSPGRRDALEPPHGSVSVLDPVVILLKPVVEIDVCPVPHHLAEFAPDRGWATIVTVGGKPVRQRSRHRPGGREERPGGRKVPALAQHHVYQGSIVIDSSIQKAPLAADRDLGFVGIPAATVRPYRRWRRSSARACVSFASHSRAVSWLRTIPRSRNISLRSGRLSLYLRTPEHHQRDDVARVLCLVQQATTALVELLGTCASAKPRYPCAVRSGRSVTPADPHPMHRSPVRPRSECATPSRLGPLTRKSPPGPSADRTRQTACRSLARGQLRARRRQTERKESKPRRSALVNRSPQLGVTVHAIRYLLIRTASRARQTSLSVFQWIDWHLRHNAEARQADYRRHTREQL